MVIETPFVDIHSEDDREVDSELLALSVVETMSLEMTLEVGDSEED